MKKMLICCFLACCLLASCEPESQKIVESQDGTTISVRSFELNGHKYYEFIRRGAGMYDNYTGFVHDPECLKQDMALKE